MEKQNGGPPPPFMWPLPESKASSDVLRPGLVLAKYSGRNLRTFRRNLLLLSSEYLRNVNKLLLDYMESHVRRTAPSSHENLQYHRSYCIPSSSAARPVHTRTLEHTHEKSAQETISVQSVPATDTSNSTPITNKS